ncbi:thiolase family protein [Thermodesulfobacteriota bacterium]
MYENNFRDRFCIVGLGVTKVGHLPGSTSQRLEIEAARIAIEDAGLAPQDIDAAIQAESDTGSGVRPRYADAFPRMLGLPVKVYIPSVGRGGEVAMMSILSATQLLSLGIAKYVLIAGARDDWSRGQKVRAQQGGVRGRPFMEKEGAWGRPYGHLTAASIHGFFATRHMHEHGTTSRQFGAVAVAERQWACLNPHAYMHGRPITIEDHQSSPIVVWPYHLLDICLRSDGGTAFIVTTAERAKNLKKPPVYLMGIGFGEQMAKLWWDKTSYTTVAVETAKRDAFRMAGIELKDIDVAEFYDCFTPEVVFQLEDYGWCKKGEGGPFVEEGHIGPGGDLPVNTGGGLLSSHHLDNLTCVSEAIIQMRGEGGNRQVKDAEIALATGHGGEIVPGQMCSIHSTLILRR